MDFPNERQLEESIALDLRDFPILVKVWAGSEPHDMRYIRRSLPSLLQSRLPAEAHVILVDDCSPNPAIQSYLTELARRYPRVSVRQNPQRLGPNKGQEYNVPLLWQEFPDAPFLVCCDDDVIYHPGWLQRLIHVYHEARETGVNGVFSALNTPARPSQSLLRLPTSEVLIKERQMALNWLVPREVYEAVGPFRDIGIAYDTDYANRMSQLGFLVICLKPSYVQNIGYQGAYQCDDSLTARDFVGRRDAYLVLRDGLYGIRRLLIKSGECIPDGKFKNLLKMATKPIRKHCSFL